MAITTADCKQAIIGWLLSKATTAEWKAEGMSPLVRLSTWKRVSKTNRAGGVVREFKSDEPFDVTLTVYEDSDGVLSIEVPQGHVSAKFLVMIAKKSVVNDKPETQGDDYGTW